MAKNTSVSIGEHLSAFVKGQLSEGRYESASEVVRAGLRLLQDKEAERRALREALIAGEQSGPAEDFDFNDYIKRKERA